MFYSHQLLARKAPLGQIWMAATMHAKINRRKLDKLDIIKICEEILNPSVPMALRLSGILMGGVVIVYERKVKLLYDDVNRFMVEINEAWKVKSGVDPTVLPKGKIQAKYEAVTLPDNVVDMEVEQAVHFSDASFTAARLQRMRLDDLDENYINIDPREDDNHHQAEPANITMFDDFTSGFAEADLFNRFERFDIGEDEDTQINFTPPEHPQFEPTIIPSPPPQNVRPQGPTSHISSPTQNGLPPQDGQQVEEQEDRQPEECRNNEQVAAGDDRRPQARRRKKTRSKLPRVIFDDERIMIPGNIYQSWLQDASDIVEKRARKHKSLNPIRTAKVGILMDLPPVALITGLEKFTDELYYPAPLLELWKKCTQTTHARGSPSGTSAEAQNNPASHSPPEDLYRRNIPEFPPGDFQSEIGNQPIQSPIERSRAAFHAATDALPSNSSDKSQGLSSRSIPSSGSGHDALPMAHVTQLTSSRSTKRQHSSASFRNLEPVEEELPSQHSPGFKIPRLSEDEPAIEMELLEETGPTQTPHPVVSDPADKITQSIRTQLKLHFDTPGAPQSESLDQLASGMNRKKAAQLFYQTCVLATCDYVKVHQAEAYGEILISRGSRM